ncbi:hypothetical protein SAMN06295885_0043 [Rathayibacter oskolensis]|uniref:Uncharacterized protein n=1 Tax=Rathayibacter oskolensis TaxID=1891671 RepID=A0A1X7MSJ4_9MICO|nr:hypothetical protein [Rathayibacter oskolensis]SMH27792.1 hypothetical protein SAMN06295885_0043 [Rathayibacter oskolensis]
MGVEQAVAEVAPAWPGAELAALAERIGGLRAAAGGLLPDADWEDEAARRYADRAAEFLAGLAVAEGAARAMAVGGAA